MALLALWNPNIQFLKTDGTINAGGKLVVTDHNDAESVPANYSDADGTTLNSSPIVLDALGRATCYIDDGSTYDIYVKDANGATLWTVPEMTPGAETIVVRAGFSVSSNDSSVAITISVDADGVTNYDLSIQDEIDRATDAEKASKTEVAQGNNVSVSETTGANGQKIYTVGVDLSGYKTRQTAVPTPASSSGNALDFISDVSQDANGKMTIARKTVRTANESQSGVITAAKYKTWSDAETTYVSAGSDTSFVLDDSIEKQNVIIYAPEVKTLLLDHTFIDQFDAECCISIQVVGYKCKDLKIYNKAISTSPAGTNEWAYKIAYADNLSIESHLNLSASGAQSYLVHEAGQDKALHLEIRKVYSSTDEATLLTLVNCTTTSFNASRSSSGSSSLVMPSGAYLLGEWGHRTSAQKDNPDEKETYFSGAAILNGKTYANGREWGLDWRPYVVTMTCSNEEYTAKAKTPVMELKKNNWLRTTDGGYSTVVGITSAQATACDKLLYWDAAKAHPIGSGFYTTYDTDNSTYVFDPASFWEYCNSSISIATINAMLGTSYKWATDVKLYDSSPTELSYGNYTSAHIVAPWETTDLDLGVYIGRPDDCYLLDGVVGDSGKEWSGILNTAQVFDGIDVSKYKLARTGMSPGPVTAKLRNGAWSTRSFFYNFAAGTAFSTSTDFTTDMSDCCNGAYYYDSTWSAPFRNNGHYPWTSYRSTTDNDPTFEHFGVNQFTAQVCNRNMNSAITSPYPFAEGGYHAKNTFLNSVEVGFGTKNLGLNTRFSQGSSHIYPCSTEDEFLLNGGVGYYNGANWSYHTWDETNSINSSYGNWSRFLRRWKPAFQCMEAQIAASLAVEMGVGPGESFTWNGGEWWYNVPTETEGYSVTAPLDGEMNCRMYKLITITNGTKKVKTNLVCGLLEGMNVSGDIIVYEGGGCELCVSPIYGNSSDARSSFDRIDCFLEIDQTKWHSEDLPASSWTSGWYYKPNGTQFGFESTYEKVAQGYVFAGYARRRLPYSPIADELVAGYNPSGDDLDKGGEIGACAYMNTKYDDYGQTYLAGGVATGYRHRKTVRFRGTSSGDTCSARSLNAKERASNVFWYYGLTAQVLLG